MDALLTSVAAVGLAEIGDKTQLLALLLVARFLAPWSILWGILVATLINHGVSAWLGTALADMLDPQTLTITVGFAFLAIGIWLLKPDDDEALNADNVRYGVFMTAFVLFFVAEIGDKTQVATVLLGARFDDVLAVTLGTTLGMVAANAPVLWVGHRFCRDLPLKTIHGVASLLFIAIGLWTLCIETGWLTG